MKAILLSLCLLPAFASAMTLGADPCGINKQCLSVPNDAAASLDIYASPSLPYISINLNGVPYSAKSGNGLVIDNALLTDADGNIVYLSATFTSYRTCVRSGRGQTCSTHWSLVGGTLQ